MEQQEEFKVNGAELIKKVKELIAQGNARKIIIKTEDNETIAEFPLTIGAIGLVLAPMFAALGTLAAILSNCTIVVIKNEAKN